MDGMAEKSTGPRALDVIWLDEAPSQVSGPGCGVADLFSWDGAAGTDFAAEVESVSRLFPHLDGLPSELTGDGSVSVAEQAAVCGGTRVALGAGGFDLTPGSPADPPLPSPGDQCLMSPSDALLASPDPSLGSSPPGSSLLGSSPSLKELAAAGDRKVATGGLQLSEVAHFPADNTVADKITTLIEFVEPARALVIQPPPVEEIFVSPTDFETKQTSILDTTPTQNVSITEASTVAVAELSAAAELSALSPVEIVSPAVYETAAASDSTLDEFSQSPAIDFLPAPAEEEDEHTRMIDQALEDLKTLESMCGITSDDTTTTSSSSMSVAASLASNAITVQATARSTAASPVTKATATADAVKQETITNEEDDIEIVEERPAPRRRRRRPPRVAVTPAAAPATQIVIVLTNEQLAGIQKSGQIVLNAATLQAGSAAAEALTAGGKAVSKAQKAQASSRAQSKGQVTSKARSGKVQTVVKPSTVVKGQSSVRSATIVRPTSTITSTVTSGAGTSGVITSGAITSGAITSGASTSSASTSSASTSGAETVVRKALKRPQVIVKQESAKRAKRIAKRPASSKDPLSGWTEQKLPAAGAGWDFSLLPAQALEQELPLRSDGGFIPEDLQDVLLDGTDTGAVPSLPADAADCLLEELISGSVRENPGLFDGVPPAEEVTKPAVCAPAVMEEMVPLPQQQQPAPLPAGMTSPQPMLLAPAPVGYSLLSPQPQQQLTLESWVPTLCPSPGEDPVSPISDCSSPELAPAPDWQPGPAARRGARRPRPYDKQQQGGKAGARRQPLTEEERRERKKEQNKNAATRYRQKKKEEHDLVSGDQEMLEARNKVLRDRVGSLSSELNYLKQLMREVLRHKQVSV